MVVGGSPVPVLTDVDVERLRGEFVAAIRCGERFEDGLRAAGMAVTSRSRSWILRLTTPWSGYLEAGDCLVHEGEIAAIALSDSGGTVMHSRLALLPFRAVVREAFCRGMLTDLHRQE